jgi:DNA replication protein DnaC
VEEIDYTPLQKSLFAADQRKADKEAANCAECKVSGSIAECPNWFKGFMGVINHYPDGMPFLAVKECEQNRRLKAEHRIKTMMGATGLGERFWSRTFENFALTDSTREGYTAAEKYSRTFQQTRRWLILTGNYGTGKTHLAVAVLQVAIQQGVVPAFATAPDMLARLRSSYQAEDTRELTDWLAESPLLIIDDLGKERADAKAVEFIFQILNDRYESNLPTVITTNLDGGEMVTRYGKAIMSRLNEVADIVVMSGEDWRMKNV